MSSDVARGVLVLGPRRGCLDEAARLQDAGAELTLLDVSAVSAEAVVEAAARFRSRGLSLVVLARALEDVPVEARRNLERVLLVDDVS